MRLSPDPHAGGAGLSVEQRKRLSIAVELVANPSVVFSECAFRLLTHLKLIGQKWWQSSDGRHNCVACNMPGPRVLPLCLLTLPAPTLPNLPAVDEPTSGQIFCGLKAIARLGVCRATAAC